MYIDLSTQDGRHGDKNVAVTRHTRAGDCDFVGDAGSHDPTIRTTSMFPRGSLSWTGSTTSHTWETTKTIADEGHAHEVKDLDRISLWSNGVFTIEGDPRHRNILIKSCSGVDSRLAMSWSGSLKASAASKVRTKYMSLDRAALLSVARVASQYMSAPRQGSEMDVKK